MLHNFKRLCVYWITVLTLVELKITKWEIYLFNFLVYVYLCLCECICTCVCNYMYWCVQRPEEWIRSFEARVIVCETLYLLCGCWDHKSGFHNCIVTIFIAKSYLSSTQQNSWSHQKQKNRNLENIFFKI